AAPDLRDGLRGGDGPAARRSRLALARYRGDRPGGGRTEAPRNRAPADCRRRSGDPRAGFHPEARPLDVRVLPVPGGMPIERRHVTEPLPGIAAITFDFGNTLVPVGRAGLRAV